MAMNKSDLPPLRVVHVDEGLIVRGCKTVIDGGRARRSKVIADLRGRQGDAIRADDPGFGNFGQVYFTTTFPGVVKAWHYHKLQTDHFYCVRGVIKLGMYDSLEGSATHGEVNEIYMSEHLPSLVRI